jgi:ribosomal protein L29
MKVKTLKDELKQMSRGQLEVKLDELRRELLTLRLQAATSPVKAWPSTKRALRRSIACGLTFLRQKSMYTE